MSQEAESLQEQERPTPAPAPVIPGNLSPYWVTSYSIGSIGGQMSVSYTLTNNATVTMPVNTDTVYTNPYTVYTNPYIWTGTVTPWEPPDLRLVFDEWQPPTAPPPEAPQQPPARRPQRPPRPNPAPQMHPGMTAEEVQQYGEAREAERRDYRRRELEIVSWALTSEERERIATDKYLDVPSVALPGRVYRVPYISGDMVEVLENGVQSKRLCLQPAESYLRAGQWLVLQVMLIRANERRYLQKAIHWDRRGRMDNGYAEDRPRLAEEARNRRNAKRRLCRARG